MHQKNIKELIKWLPSDSLSLLASGGYHLGKEELKIFNCDQWKKR
tara:strand:- start:317 stop:451 length:135 start_codon:yes stop_codon:yes gene_type:complete